jgi:hypothetical protein
LFKKFLAAFFTQAVAPLYLSVEKMVGSMSHAGQISCSFILRVKPNPALDDEMRIKMGEPRQRKRKRERERENIFIPNSFTLFYFFYPLFIDLIQILKYADHVRLINSSFQISYNISHL